MINSTSADARLRIFASASSWIEGAAVRQLEQVLGRRGVLAVAGMPDLHPGHKGPVGCAVLTEGIVHPDIVGTDIGCGMTAWLLDGVARRLRVEKAVQALSKLGDAGGLEPEDAVAAGIPADVAAAHAEALGTVGGGNHFVELQAVHAMVDGEACAAAGLEAGRLVLLVHSGSRGLGPEVLARHPFVHGEGLALEGAGRAYLADHDVALGFARLNRAVLAERAADLIGQDGKPWLDVPHNHVTVAGDLVLHRKGAAQADLGLVPVPGSRGAMTYVVAPDPDVPGALRSLAHGAGRKRDRASMHGRRRDAERPNPVGNRVICADRKLAMEEAPGAYKDIAQVVADLDAHGLARVVAILKPIVTFKTGRA
ncbi:RNA ligase RtcB family protein [Labrys wisconsinensis]|uniref:3'-phosphate/5'-hydroxy nucleic acid ligase n=1 Tax=Labrys wisconsinensis TaxID=425677 RepID=A0ABU0J7L9_9HYPH|nr:RNA ligase RtcB family protein [Labrys wisconsinensis]MDQ0470272.1 release factor H-coupled RctB family protein [Labrys wisconsinensis]